MICQHCQADVMVTGYTLVRRQNEAYLKIGGKMSCVATAIEKPHAAVCTVCMGAIPKEAVLG